jgi:murein DD-endopeptidase MepM/ murein hydrolase activator NlpD
MAAGLPPIACGTGATPAPAGVIVTCPDSVPEGEPFQVQLSVSAGVQSLTVSWQGLHMQPTRIPDEGQRLPLMLGMGLRERQSEDAPLLAVSWRTPAGPDSLSRRVRRAGKAYPEQRLDVDSRYSEPSAEQLARNERERAQVRAALATVSPQRLWRAPLTRPVPGELRSDFGLRRVFNGVAGSPHAGVDLRAAEGDAVLACADGRVILVGDHFYAGKSIYIDHGQGLISMVFHLSEIAVREGDVVTAGQRIGRAGATGRVTGAHVHWGASLWGQLVDPLVLMAITAKEPGSAGGP